MHVSIYSSIIHYYCTSQLIKLTSSNLQPTLHVHSKILYTKVPESLVLNVIFVCRKFMLSVNAHEGSPNVCFSNILSICNERNKSRKKLPLFE